MSINKITGVFVMSVALLNLVGCCQSSCSDVDVADQTRTNINKPKVAIKETQQKVVGFAYNSAELSDKDADLLSSQALALLKNNNQRIQIEGHTDERGSDSYNFALGERRAKAVADLLERNGISADRIATISYGKKKPLVNEANDQANALNRRAELKYIGADE